MALRPKTAVQRKKRPYKIKHKGGAGESPEQPKKLTVLERQQVANYAAQISTKPAARAEGRVTQTLLEENRDKIERERKKRETNIENSTKVSKLLQEKIPEETKSIKLDHASKVLDQAKTVEATDLIQRQQQSTDINRNLAEKRITGEQLKNIYARTKQVTATAETGTSFIRVIWRAIKEIGTVIVKIFVFIFNNIKQLLGGTKELLSTSKIASYIALILFIIFILFITGYFIVSARKRPTPAPKPISQQKPTLEEKEEGSGFQLKTPEIPTPSFNFVPPRIRLGIDNLFGGFFGRVFPGYKAQVFARNFAATVQPNLPPQEITKRQRIAGRCDNIKFKEMSLNSGEGGICTSDEVPTPIRWVIDSAKIPDYNVLPEQLKKEVTNNGTKNIITIPWKSDGFVYSPDCAKATYGGGSNLANLLSDYNTEYCQKREVDKTKYEDAWRIKKQMSYYKGIDVFE